ncbi:MAG: helix-turn-helix domain-containing protein [Lachnospiraceae bacterium]|nr:helix-turn-helix domain-containing protein [Lachnospiraceae bacterium]
MKTWKEVRNNLDLKEDDERIIELEKELIRTMVSIREQQGISQAELSKICNVKQPAIARMEKDAHSPRIDSLLKILTPLGYTLQIVPFNN